MSKRKPDQHKAVLGPDETKLDLRTVSGDQATLERNARIDGGTYDGSHVVSVCYNAACPDYRRERVGGVSCGCRRTSVESK